MGAVCPAARARPSSVARSRCRHSCGGVALWAGRVAGRAGRQRAGRKASPDEAGGQRLLLEATGKGRRCRQMPENKPICLWRVAAVPKLRGAAPGALCHPWASGGTTRWALRSDRASNALGYPRFTVHTALAVAWIWSIFLSKHTLKPNAMASAKSPRYALARGDSGGSSPHDSPTHPGPGARQADTWIKAAMMLGGLLLVALVAVAGAAAARGARDGGGAAGSILVRTQHGCRPRPAPAKGAASASALAASAAPPRRHPPPGAIWTMCAVSPHARRCASARARPWTAAT